MILNTDTNKSIDIENTNGQINSHKEVLLLLVGASGCGKDTIANHLVLNHKLVKVKSYTTRPVRLTDLQTELNSHIFVNEEEFSKLSDKCAYTKFNGYEYCATISQLNESDIYIVDPAGVVFLSNYATQIKKHILVINLTVSEEERQKRMLSRGDSIAKVEERIIHDREQFSKENLESIMALGIQTVSLDVTNENPSSAAELVYAIYNIYKEALNGKTDDRPN